MPGWTSPLATACDEGRRLDDHALAAAGRERFPPGDSGGLAPRVGDVDHEPLGALQPAGSGVDESIAELEVPVVAAVDEDAALRRQDMERGEPEVVDALDRPRVPPVGLGVAQDVLVAPALVVEECGDVEAAPGSAFVSMLLDSPARAAAPTAAYCRRMSCIALADHGRSSQSRTSHPVSSASHSPAASAAARTRASAASVCSRPSRNARPVRV